MNRQSKISFETIKGDILSDEIAKQVDYIVNPVNKVGVMGAGLALSFRNKYPEMFNQYKVDCSKGIYKTSVYKMPPNKGASCGSNVNIICLPTKNHWKDRSTINLIEQSLLEMFELLFKITQGNRDVVIAVPKIGCGLGGLDWNSIKPDLIQMMKKQFNSTFFPENKSLNCNIDIIFVEDN